MSFTNPFATKTDDVSTLPASEVNAAGVSINRAVDGLSGGTWAGNQTWNGTQSFSQIVTHSGTNGRTVWRVDTSTLGDADATVDVSKDVWHCNVAVLSLRDWTLRHSTSPIPNAGEAIDIVKVGGGGSSVNIKREDGTVVAALGTAWGSVRVMYLGGVWRLIHATGSGAAGAGA